MAQIVKIPLCTGDVMVDIMSPKFAELLESYDLEHAFDMGVLFRKSTELFISRMWENVREVADRLRDVIWKNPELIQKCMHVLYSTTEKREAEILRSANEHDNKILNIFEENATSFRLTLFATSDPVKRYQMVSTRPETIARGFNDVVLRKSVSRAKKLQEHRDAMAVDLKNLLERL